MKLTVTTNWADDFIDRVRGFEEVEWIRGRLYKDEIGSRDVSFNNFSKRPTRKIIEKAIKKIHSCGKKFSYMFDGSCTSNKEYSWEGQEKIRENLRWIDDSGADSVIVIAPYLVEVIKGQFPRLKVELASAFLVIGEIKRIKYYNGLLGVDSMVIKNEHNRNPRLLKAFKKVANCNLKLVANSICLYCCNFLTDHSNVLSHISNFTAEVENSRYYNYICNKMRLDKPEELIKAPFIRPEDISIYESYGYEDFILDLNSPHTDDAIRTIKAYISRRYDGNLLEILSSKGEKPFQNDNGKVEEDAPQLDNRGLDGFIKYFVDGNECHYSVCGTECNYCKGWRKTIHWNNKRSAEVLKAGFQKRIEEIEAGIF